MNIKFESVDIEKFRSIEHAMIRLDSQGIIIVKGVNEYENKATSNGSGKSSIFEAIIFAIYEETSSGEKDVANRILGDGYVVTLKFTIDLDEYVIMRKATDTGKSSVVFYKNGVDISARNKTDTNKLILSVFGISKSVFLDSIFLSQNANTNLATLSPTARKERLEILTNTDSTIIKFKDDLKMVQNRYESDCVNDQLSMNKLQGSKETNLLQMADIQRKIENIQREIDNLKQLGNISEIDAEIDRNEKLILEYNTEIEQINVKLNQIESDIQKVRLDSEEDNNMKTKLETERQDKLKELNNVDSDIDKLKMEITYLQNEIKKIEQDINKIKNSDKCPTCGRKYDNFNDEHIKKTIAEMLENIDSRENKIQKLKNDINALNDKANVIISEGKGIADQLKIYVDKVDVYKDKVSKLEQDRFKLSQNKDNNYNLQRNCQDKIKQLSLNKEQILKTPINNIEEFSKMKNEITSTIMRIDNQIEEIQNKFNMDNDKVLVVKNAIQLVTKEFRTYLLQSSIQYLNKLLAEYSKHLFSNAGDIIYIEEDGTKLNINLGKASYESLSGGERTRVNIALLLAQKSLANMIGNMNCNLIILDEILGYCDSHAEEVVIDLITQELDSLESIFMVSHKEIPIGYDAQLTVIKDSRGLSKVSIT